MAWRGKRIRKEADVCLVCGSEGTFLKIYIGKAIAHQCSQMDKRMECCNMLYNDMNLHYLMAIHMHAYRMLIGIAHIYCPFCLLSSSPCQSYR